MTTPCLYKHTYRYVNNMHLLPVSDIDSNSQMWEWRTERRCEECNKLFEVIN